MRLASQPNCRSLSLTLSAVWCLKSVPSQEVSPYCQLKDLFLKVHWYNAILDFKNVIFTYPRHKHNLFNCILPSWRHKCPDEMLKFKCLFPQWFIHSAPHSNRDDEDVMGNQVDVNSDYDFHFFASFPVHPNLMMLIRINSKRLCWLISRSG